MREIISIQVGQGGIQLGDLIWELFSKEHLIGKDGSFINQQIDDNNLYQKFNKEKGEGKLVSRSIFIDSEPNIIDQIRNSKYKSLYEPEQFINGKENSGGNFAKGCNTIGSNLIDAILDKIRIQVENCEILRDLQYSILLDEVQDQSIRVYTYLLFIILEEQK